MITSFDVKQEILRVLEAARRPVKGYVRKGAKGKPVRVKEYQREFKGPLHPKQVAVQVAKNRLELKKKAASMYRSLRPANKAGGAGDQKLAQVTNVDAQSQKEIQAMWVALSKQFPKVAAWIKGVDVKSMKGEDKGTYAESGEQKIIFGKEFLSDRKQTLGIVEADEKSGFYHKGVSKNPWGYFLAHEFGHNIMFVISDQPEYENWEKAWQKNKRSFKRDVSSYSVWDAHEGFAEAFANRMVLRNNQFPKEVDAVLAAIERSNP